MFRLFLASLACAAVVVIATEVRDTPQDIVFPPMGPTDSWKLRRAPVTGSISQPQSCGYNVVDQVLGVEQDGYERVHWQSGELGYRKIIDDMRTYYKTHLNAPSVLPIQFTACSKWKQEKKVAVGELMTGDTDGSGYVLSQKIVNTTTKICSVTNVLSREDIRDFKGYRSEAHSVHMSAMERALMNCTGLTLSRGFGGRQSQNQDKLEQDLLSSITVKETYLNTTTTSITYNIKDGDSSYYGREVTPLYCTVPERVEGATSSITYDSPALSPGIFLTTSDEPLSRFEDYDIRVYPIGGRAQSYRFQFLPGINVETLCVSAFSLSRDTNTATNELHQPLLAKRERKMKK